METTLQIDRTIPLEGCGNFRDLGGYETVNGRRTRWRRLFRSDSLHWLTEADYAVLRRHDIQLVACFDLRTVNELEKTGAGLLAGQGVEHRHTPFIASFGIEGDETAMRDRMRAVALSTGQVQSETYLELFEQAGPCFRTLFEALADEASYPAALYCAAGKDRTGMVAAIVLRVLGVPDETIIEDYTLTKPLDQERWEARMRALDSPAERRNFDPALFIAKRETMERFLEAFDSRYPSVEAYLEAQGVTAETLSDVRHLLLEA